VEGFGYDKTLSELKSLYAANGEDAMDDDDYSLVPAAIRDMLGCKNAIEALGSMMWCAVIIFRPMAAGPNDTLRYLRQLNIDKDILTMKNFNVYDPMKRGQGLVLDGQSLAHVEVLLNSEGTDEGSLLQLLSRCVTPFGQFYFTKSLPIFEPGIQESGCSASGCACLCVVSPISMPGKSRFI
jgi:DNA mismatch repair protein MSH6